MAVVIAKCADKFCDLQTVFLDYDSLSCIDSIL